MAKFTGFGPFEYVTPDELREALAAHSNNFVSLDALNRANEALKARIDALAEELRKRDYSEEIEGLYKKLAEDRNALDKRFERLAALAYQGQEPTDSTINDLFRQFEKRYTLTTDTADQIAEIKATADEALSLAGKTSEAVTRLNAWLKAVFHIADDDTEWNGHNRFDEIDDQFAEVHGRIDETNGRVDGINQRLLDVEAQLRQNKFSTSTFIITLLGLTVLGGLLGWAFGTWVAGAIIGFIAGAIIGFMLGSRQGRRPSRPVPPNPVGTNPRPTPRS